jgi:superfamily II DNA helicase RecQ
MYQLIGVNPELLVQDRHFDDLWKDTKFTSHTIWLIFDEGHCISQWGGTFCPEYAMLERLRYLLPHGIQFYVASATLPKVILDDVRQKLRLKPDTCIIRQSNACWNCHLMVRHIRQTIKSFKDLDFLVPKDWKSGDKLPHKFLVFFNSRKEVEAATEYLWLRFGLKLKEHIVWFHSVMTDDFHEDSLNHFKEGLSDEGLCSLMCTDAAGMVSL